MRPAFLAILSTLSLLFSTSAYADWRCAISSSPRCVFMELCEKKATPEACQCAWDFSPDGWSSISRSAWPDLIGFILEPSTYEYQEQRYFELEAKFGKKELDTLHKTLAPNGDDKLFKCNSRLAAARKPGADLVPVPAPSP